MEYKIVVCGGTFDHLHKGHEDFLHFIFSVGEKVIIGLTSDSFTAAHKDHVSLESYEVRYKTLCNFLEKENLFSRVKIASIDDIYGPSIDPNITFDAVVVTDETIEGAEKINFKRKELGLSVLPIVIMPRIRNISSTMIREGKIDTSGSLFIEEQWVTKSHLLPKELREELQQPFGKLIKEDTLPDIHDNQIITVGDATTLRFHQAGKRQKIAVVDFTVERKRIYSSLSELGFTEDYENYEVINPAATLTPILWQAVYDSFTNRTQKEMVIRISGEEDLAVIPIILVAPLGYHLFYGQPHIGLVWVEITLESKKKAYALLRRFL